jgi:predicted SAM-dependent methyltransferase
MGSKHGCGAAKRARPCWRRHQLDSAIRFHWHSRMKALVRSHETSLDAETYPETSQLFGAARSVLGRAAAMAAWPVVIGLMRRVVDLTIGNGFLDSQWRLVKQENHDLYRLLATVVAQRPDPKVMGGGVIRSLMLAIYARLRRQPWLYDQDHDSMRAGYRGAAHVMLRLACRGSALRYWARSKRRGNGAPWRLNLGSGRRPLPGWTNVDINPFAGADAWIDLRDPWPFEPNSVETIYTRHCFEHFSERELRRILDRCWRALRATGGIRIGVPSLEAAMKFYAEGGFPDWVTQKATSPGRRFFSYVMDDGNHGVILDFSYMAELLEASGFVDIQRFTGGQSRLIEPQLLSPNDCSEDTVTLYVEAQKPKA